MTASDDPSKLIEKLGLAIHGEDPNIVMSVMAAFVVELCARYKVPVDQFIDAIRAHHPSLRRGPLGN